MQGWAGRWPLVGRKPLLDAFTQDLSVGGTHGWMIYGPAGIGKHAWRTSSWTWRPQADAAPRELWPAKPPPRYPSERSPTCSPPDVDLTDPVVGFRSVARALAGPRAKHTAVFVDDMHLLDNSSAVLLSQLLDSGFIA
ncbi:ATP-binding protein [Streptomyces sp. NPDC060002]|uniref:ATP-binding protein n=1 Tax=Streptomyces sp. NPDC060002 TaxID=3347033 RepID=UPI0036A634B2